MDSNSKPQEKRVRFAFKGVIYEPTKTSEPTPNPIESQRPCYFIHKLYISCGAIELAPLLHSSACSLVRPPFMDFPPGHFLEKFHDQARDTLQKEEEEDDGCPRIKTFHGIFDSECSYCDYRTQGNYYNIYTPKTEEEKEFVACKTADRLSFFQNAIREQEEEERLQGITIEQELSDLWTELAEAEVARLRSVSEEWQEKKSTDWKPFIFVNCQSKKCDFLPFSEEDSAQENPTCLFCGKRVIAGDGSRKLPCGHPIHETCVLLWVRIRFDCNTCGYDTTQDELIVVPSFQMESLHGDLRSISLRHL